MAIATLQEPDKGSIRLGELDVLRQKDEVRKTLGYLPQEFGLYPKVSAESLLDHFAVLKGIAGRRERKEVVEALLRQTNLWEVRKQKLGGYSGGMRQRFGVEVNAYWELETEQATAVQTAAGMWQVTLAVTVTVPHRPARAGIDPHNLLIKWEIDDNVKAVRVQN